MPAGLPRLSVLQLNGDPRVLHSFPTRRSSDLSFCPGHAASLFAVRGCNYSNVRCVCRGAPEVSAEGARRRYVYSVDKPLQEILAEPHFVGLTRELAMVRFGTWIGSFFVYRPPQFGFRPAISACCSLLWEVEQTRTSPKRSRSPFLR